MSAARRFAGSAEGLAGAAILFALAALALAAPHLFPLDPLRIAGPPLVPPFADAAFPLGTDRLGRDVAAGLAHSARTSLLVGLAAAVAALSLGTLVGTLAGFARGIAGAALMRVVDGFQAVPAFLLALALVSVAGASLPAMVAAVALGAWTAPARVARAGVLSIRERDYVANAAVAGMHPLAVALREVLPNALPPVLSLSAVIVAGAVLTEAALSFLGFGDPNRVTWGGMIAEGRTVLRSAPSLSILPGLMLVVTVVGVHLFGEGLTEALSARRIRA